MPSISRAATPAMRIFRPSAHQIGPSPSQTAVGVHEKILPDGTIVTVLAAATLKVLSGGNGSVGMNAGSTSAMANLVRKCIALAVAGATLSLVTLFISRNATVAASLAFVADLAAASVA